MPPISLEDRTHNEFHFMTYQFHFMTDEIHFMTEPTSSGCYSFGLDLLAE